MPLILGANTLSAGGYEVDNSLRFNSGSTEYLQRTPGSAGSLTTWTYSFWTKRSVLATAEQYLSAGPRGGGGNVEDQLYSISTDQINWYDGTAASNVLRTTQLFRDVSAWYHIMYVWDTTNATAGDRARIYVNGAEVTAFSVDNNPSLNDVSKINGTGQHRIGQVGTLPGENLNGYLAEVNFIDGQALAPSDFGEFDEDSGIWKPIAYEGTYGTNGFFLEFKDSSALGDDTSGNGNDFTVNNLTSIDQTYDSPTNNFATFNSIKFAGGDLTQGNLELDSTSGSWKTRNSTIGVSTGKWFMEFKMGTITDDQSGVAIVPDTVPDGNFPASDATRSPAIAYNSEGKKWVNGTGTGSYFATMTSNDIIGIALDMDNGTVQFYRNGSTTGSPINLSDAFTSSNYPLFFVAAVYGTRDVQANFGYPPFTISSGNADANGYGNFEYAVPSGYYALNTKNLAEYG
jgi:hypothetical protein